MGDQQNRPASSATAGFFQSLPVIPPAYTSVDKDDLSRNHGSPDFILGNIVRLYLPVPLPAALDRSLHDFARTCIDPNTLRLTVDCENNPPTLHTLTTFGEVNNVDPLRTSEGWKGLKEIQTRAGVVAHGYQNAISGNDFQLPYNFRIHQFALQYLWQPSCASVSCPAAMTDGAAILLAKHLANSSIPATPGQDSNKLRQVLSEAYARLTSFDPAYAWTSGQWMTERSGGSDVSRTETLAHLASEGDLLKDKAAYKGLDCDAVGMPLGPYIVNGFKWFSSATDADMVVLLAQTRKGLSAFYAPMRRAYSRPSGGNTSVMNGIRISRLKNKLGTKGLPTAELEIAGMRAWLLGEEGKGVREISAILNATRLWTASGAIGGWGRGLDIARAYATTRKIKGGALLADNRQHVKWMAEESVKFRACVHFAFLGVALLGVSEQGWYAAADKTYAQQWLPQGKTEATSLLRILTPVMKAQCSLWSTWGLRECMESLGGVGYCENQEDNGIINIARIFRDSNVNSIWEGTTNILAEDFVRSAKSSSGLHPVSALSCMFAKMLALTVVEFPDYTLIIRTEWIQLQDRLKQKDVEELLYHGRELLQIVQRLVCSCLLMLDALHSEQGVEKSVAERWMLLQFPPENQSAPHAPNSLLKDTECDRVIFLGGLQCAELSRTDHKL